MNRRSRYRRAMLRASLGCFALAALPLGALVWLNACGSGGPSCYGSALSAEWAAVYAEVEKKTKLSAPAPLVKFDDRVPCIDGSGKWCLASWPHLGNVYDWRCETLVIQRDQENLDGALRHEAVHHLLYKNRRDDWHGHSAPEFAGFREI